LSSHFPESSVSPKREPVFFLPFSVLLFIAVCCAAFILQRYVFGSDMNAYVIFYGAFIPARYEGFAHCAAIVCLSSSVTYSLLHGSFAHLAINMVWLAAFGAPLAQRIGTVRFILFWIFTSLCAAGLHFLLYSTSALPLIGASGAISGMMGAAARFGFRTSATGGVRQFAGDPLTLTQALRARQVITFVAVWMVVNLVSGIGLAGSPDGSSGIAWEAHIGGFLAGFFVVAVFDK
jgi:membrane associated rhomboid family serine protease